MEVKFLKDATPIEESSLSRPEFLVGRDGFFIRKRTFWGKAQVPVERCSLLENPEPRFIPCPSKKVPRRTFQDVLLILFDIYRKYNSEGIVLLLNKGDTIGWEIPPQRVSRGSIKYSMPPPTFQLVGSVHSHPGFGAFHSSIDSEDEKKMDGLNLVVSFDDQGKKLEVVGNISINGYRFPIDPKEIIEEFDTLIPTTTDISEEISSEINKKINERVFSNHPDSVPDDYPELKIRSLVTDIDIKDIVVDDLFEHSYNIDPCSLCPFKKWRGKKWKL